MTAMVMTACTGQQSDTASQNSDKEFNYVVDQFADLEILRYKVPGFESLSLDSSLLSSGFRIPVLATKATIISSFRSGLDGT